MQVFRSQRMSVSENGVGENRDKGSEKIRRDGNPGESIAEVRKRNVEALMDVLNKYDGHNIVIGTHGTAFSTILDYLSSEYGYDDFIRMMDWMPNIVEIVFDGKEVAAINELGHLPCKGVR